MFICEAVDIGDRVVGGTTPERIAAFANHPDVQRVHVVSLRKGEYSLPANVAVHCLNHRSNPRFYHRLITLARFHAMVLWLILRYRVDTAYCYMSSMYPILLAPYRLLFGLQVCLWWGHTRTSWLGRLGITHFTDKWFTANQTTAPYRSDNLHLVGQGVNQHLFRPLERKKSWDFITVGRITPIKQIDTILRALALCKDASSSDPTLVVCGEPVYEEDRAYFAQLRDLVDTFGLADNVVFAGRVPYTELPEYYNRSGCFVFATKGGVAKVVLEAMSCSIPAIVAEPGMRDFLPERIAEQVLCERDAESIGRAMCRALTLSEQERKTRGESLRSLVESTYNLEALTDRVVAIIRPQRASGSA